MTDMRKALEEARKVIEPFAKRADRFDAAEGDDLNLAWGVNFEIGELRAACAMIARIDAALAAPGGEAVAPGEGKGTADAKPRVEPTDDPHIFLVNGSRVMTVDRATALASLEAAASSDPDRIWNEAVEACAGCQPVTAENPNEDSYQRGRFDGIIEFGKAILRLRRPAATNGTAENGVIAEIAAERRRQIEAEGWSVKHDDQHSDGSLGAAAACYAAPSPEMAGRSVTTDVSGGRGDCPVWADKIVPIPAWWPQSWDPQFWKPKDRRRDLIRAGALIVAEIERLDRRPAATRQAGDET